MAKIVPTHQHRDRKLIFFYEILAPVCIGCFVLSQGKLGSIFLLPLLSISLIYFSMFPQSYIKIFGKNLPVFAFPVLALISTTWSTNAEHTLRLSCEFFIITLSGALMAATISLEKIITSVFFALLSACLISYIFGGNEVIYYNNDIALNGFFGSKNYYALMASLLLLASCSVLSRFSTFGIIAALSAFGILFSLFLLFKTRSTGAIVTAGVCITLVALLKLLSLSQKKFIPIVILLLFIAMILFCYILGEYSSWRLGYWLNLLGKSSDLTGRAKLWSTAEVLMTISPWVGSGYQAFWVQNNSWAEGLWASSSVSSRSGFHFHNLYYEIGVETGFIGLFVFYSIAIIILIKLLRRITQDKGADSAFLVSIFLLFLMRSYLEVDFVGPFAFGNFMLPIIYFNMGRNTINQVNI